MAVKKILHILIVLLLLTPLTGELLHLNIGNFNLLPSDLILPVLLLAWGIEKWKNDRKFYFGPIGKAVLIFLAAMLASNGLNIFRFETGEMLKASVHLARISMYILSFFVIYDQLKRNKDKETEQWILGGLLGCLAGMILLGLLQFIIFPSLLETRFHLEGWDPHVNRLFGTWLDPNFVGAYLTLTLGPTLAMTLHCIKEKKWRWATGLGVLSILGIVAVGLTFSRSAYLSLMVMLGILTIFKSKKLLLLAIVAGALSFGLSQRVQERVETAWESAQALFGISEAQVDPTAQLRLDSWHNAWVIIKAYPIIGAGYNRYPYEIQKRELSTTEHAIGGSDSSMLTLWATTGLLGLLAAIGMMLKGVLVALEDIWKNEDFRSYLSTGLLAGLSALMISTIFVNGLFYVLLMIPMWTLTALLDKK